MKITVWSFWPVFVPLLVIMLTIAVAELTKFRTTKTATQYPVLDYLAGLGVRVGNDALAMLQANPALTPADALAWAEKEFRATAPDAINSLPDLAVQTLVRRGLITAANAAASTPVVMSVLTDLAPKPGTVRVTPPAFTTAPSVATATDIANVKMRLALIESRMDQSSAPTPEIEPSIQTHVGMMP